MCKAKGPNWACLRDSEVQGYCRSHDMQLRRGRPLASLGAGRLAKAVPVRLLVEANDAAVIGKEAQRREVSEATVYREAIHDRAVELKKKGGK